MTELRVASFNASLNRNNAGDLIASLSTTTDAQAMNVAEIIQRTTPDVVLINEFDFDPDGTAAALFQENYLALPQNGQAPADYPYVYVADSNTGVLSGFDLDNDGTTATDADEGTATFANDSQGFGFFPGQFGFVIYSKYAIDEDNIRTFQNFLWKDMPQNLLTNDPTQGDDNLANFYTPDEVEILRLSSKNHVDVPVIVNGETVHILAAHPTPPVFDGAEDRNGKRNFDEIRFWSDYVTPGAGGYIYDDNGVTGGLPEGERFVIVGDYNADPFDGDSVDGAVNQLLDNPNILGAADAGSLIIPASEGGPAAAQAQGGVNETQLGDPAFDTADFGFSDANTPDTAPGNLRVDYALPSAGTFGYLDGGVFWQAPGVAPFPLAEAQTSDHRLVYVDLLLTDQNRRTVEGVEFLGVTEIPSFSPFDGTLIGGLSGIVYDPLSGTYLAVADDRSSTNLVNGGTQNDGAPRFYTLSIDLSDGALDDGDIDFTGVSEFSLPAGGLRVEVAHEEIVFGTIDELSPDPEGIAIGSSGQIYVSSERNGEGRVPQIFLVDTDGTITGTLEVDDKFVGTDDDTGVRNNLGFESLTISPDRTTLWTATESALFQDGDASTVEAGAPARIVKYDALTGEAVAEYIYEVDPIATAPDPADAFADSGLVELLALDNEGTLLALERSFSIGAPERGYTGKLYLARTQGATNVIGEDAIESGLNDGEFEINVDEIVQKELLVDLGTLGIAVDNVEGLALGPVLPDGRQSLIIMSDDNFSGFGPQANQFIALALDLGTIPTIEPVLETPDELRFPGPEPIVIAHRGASGELPEHTLGAYARAINDGADFIEPDLVSTSDGVLIARHEPWLATVATDENGEVVLDDDGHPVITFASTNIAEVAKTNPDFMDRLTTKDIGFSSAGLFGAVTGWFAEDFTLAEIKTLRAVEDQPDLRPQSALFDGLFEIPTLQEVIELVQDHEARTGETIGIYPETKEPSYFDSIGLSLEEKLIETLLATGFTDPDRIFIQSFEVQNLLDLQENIMPAAGLDLPLVQLLFNAPTIPTFDLLDEALSGGDFSEYASLGFDATTTTGDFSTPEGLKLLADVYAEGLGPSFSLINNGDGTFSDLVDDAQEAGLLVHTYTHRVEGGPDYETFVASGVDGVFTDNPATGRAVTDAVFAEGSDPDDPAIWVSADGVTGAIITAMKNGGLRVYDLAGAELQRIEPDGIRYNNVDLIYGIEFNGALVDIAVASDRANDTLAFFLIGRDGSLTPITSASVPETIFGIDDGEATAYGLATYTSVKDGTPFVFVTQADGNEIAQLEVKESGDGFTFEVARTLVLPHPDGLDAQDLQSEGIAIDRETGIGYVAGEEALGLLSFDAEVDGSDAFTTIAPIDADFFEPDLEGVSIYYGDEGDGLILVSSQGDATFAAFNRETNVYLGSFAITGTNGIDGVEESDGLDIYSGALPGFANGLLVTQDGSNEPEFVFGDPEDGEIQNFNVNFKYTDLRDMLDLFGVDANPDFDPRAPIEIDTLPEGVGAGDVSEDSVVLWARSLAEGRIVFRVLEVAEDGSRTLVERQATRVTDPDEPAKVLIEGLTPGTDYIYRVRDAAGNVEKGRFSTAAEDGYNGLTFGVTGDWRGELSPYPAISNADEADLAFMILGGDTIYADFPSPALPIDQAATVDEFRTKYQEVYGTRGGENYFQDLRQSTATFATIDDHEVTNDFAGGGRIGTTAEDEFGDLFPGDDPDAFVNDATLYENGLQAFQEYHPVEDRFYGETGDARTAFERELYRAQSFGQDGAIFVLDQRSFRDEQIEGVLDPTDVEEIVRFETESRDPSRTLLGDAQLTQLKADLLEADADGVTWKFVYTPEPIQDLGLNNADSWDGYQAERIELLTFIEDNDIDNVVFVAADIHATFVNNLTYSPDGLSPQIATSTWEITTGSVAFDAPFGPSVVEAAAALGIVDEATLAFYESLPIAPDGDGLPNDRDDFLRQLFNDVTLTPAGLDPLGLDDNLDIADGLIDAELLQGGWVSAHTYGWTEFDIDAETQELTVTTWGIDFYAEEQALSDPSSLSALEPRIVSQFVVQPEPLPPMLDAFDGYEADAIFTVGETLTGTTGALNSSTEGSYTPVGILDGIGAYALDTDTVRMFVNHELLNFLGSEYTVTQGTDDTSDDFTMVGARISYFDVDKDSRQVVDAGLAYNKVIDANGNLATDTSFLLEGFAGFSRFCSGMLIEPEQFGDGRGIEDRIYFAGEEDGSFFNPVGGAEWALDVATGTLYQVPAMGRGAWENVTEIDTGTTDHVAFILADDSSPFDVDDDGEDEAAPLFLYVGKKDPAGGFLARNGLEEGKLFVWVAEPETIAPADAIRDYIEAERGEADLSRFEALSLDILELTVDLFDDRPLGERILKRVAERLDIALETPVSTPADFNGTGNERGGSWVEIDNTPNVAMASEDGSTGFDEYGYPTQRTLWSLAEDVGAFGFSRPEDVATNPDKSNEFVLASTGVDTYVDGADTFGTIYTMAVTFGDDGMPDGSSELEIVYDGDADPDRALRSPDNLDWADDGFIYVQEDEAEEDTLDGEPLFGPGAANPNEAGVLKVDPQTGAIERIANIDRSVVLDASLANPSDAVDVDADPNGDPNGEWESSGILDVSELFDEEPGTLFILDVQAHGIEDQDQFNPQSQITDDNLVEGGQLIFLSQTDDLFA